MKQTVIGSVALMFLISHASVADPESPDIRHALAADVSAERIEKDIRKLVGFGTRHTLSDTASDTRGIGAALGRTGIQKHFC